MTSNERPSHRYLRGSRIQPSAITGRESAADLIDHAFLAYNGARLREGAKLLVERMLQDDVTVALSLTGALTPAGLGMSAIIPLMEAGFVDWIVSTGANLYHDAHFGLGLAMHQGTFQVDDVELRDKGVVRIYDIFFDYSVLLDTDAFFREIISGPEFQRTMSTAEFHHLCGKYLRAREETLGVTRRSLLAAACEFGVPDLHVVARRFVDRHERGGQGARGQPAPARRQRGRQRDRGDRVGRQGRRRQERRLDPGRRQPQELPAADRTADPGGARDRGKGSRLLPRDHRRAPRHGRPLGRDARPRP